VRQNGRNRAFGDYGGVSSLTSEAHFYSRAWFLGHPYALPPSEFKELVTDETEINPGVNYILDHPEMGQTFERVVFEDHATGMALFRM
jgi:hypothetical protein